MSVASPRSPSAPRAPWGVPLLPLLFVALAACTGGRRGGAPPGDSGLDAGSSRVAAPARPAPRRVACPEGWREVVTSSGERACDPYPERGPVPCGPGEAHLPGTPGCAPLGPCAAGEWADDLPATGVVYVRAGAVGGDGSRAAPFGALSEALAAVRPGGVIALGRGLHEGELVVRGDGVRVIGACSALTSVRTAAPESPTLGAVGRGVVFQGLTVRGPGTGLLALYGAAVTARDLVIDGATLTGIAVGEGARVEAERVVVRDVRRASSGASALYADSGGSLVVRRAVIERSAVDGLTAQEAGTRVELYDVALREQAERGASIERGAVAHFERVVVDGASEAGIFCGGAGGSATLVDTRVGGVRRGGPGSVARGVMIDHAARFEADRLHVHDVAQVAVSITRDGTTAALRDLLVERVDASGGVGRGLNVEMGADVVVERAAFAGMAQVAIFSGGLGASLRAADLVVRDAVADAEGHGIGIYARGGGQVAVTRAEITDVVGVGVAAAEAGTVLRVEDVTVRDVASRPTDGRLGGGAQIRLGAALVGARLRVERTREAAIGALEAGSRVELEDLVVRDTGERACATTTCAGRGAGIGLGVWEGSAWRLTRFDVQGSALCGLQIAAGVASVALDDGLVAGHPIGVNVQAPDLPFDAVFGRVRFSGNERNVDAALLPIPEPLGVGF